MWSTYQPETLTKVHNDLDFRHLPKEWTDSFGAALFDPPYRLSGTATNVNGFDDRYGTNGAYRPLEKVKAGMLAGLHECERVVRPLGFIIVKCQDQVSSGKYQWQVGWVVNDALKRGLVFVDQLHLQSYRAQSSERRQVHARRNYSTFLVFQKPRKKRS